MKYKSRRSFLNAKISYIAKKIAGNFSEVLISNEYYVIHKDKSLPTEIIFPGVSKISDTYAEMLYERLLLVEKENSKFLKTLNLPINNKEQRQTQNGEDSTKKIEAKTIPPTAINTTSHLTQVSSPDLPLVSTFLNMTLNQRKIIIKITKYEFQWQAAATFSFILQTIPSLRRRLSQYEIHKSKLSILYNILSKNEADKIIKKLISIQKRNKAKENKQ